MGLVDGNPLVAGQEGMQGQFQAVEVLKVRRCGCRSTDSRWHGPWWDRQRGPAIAPDIPASDRLGAVQGLGEVLVQGASARGNGYQDTVGLGGTPVTGWLSASSVQVHLT